MFVRKGRGGPATGEDCYCCRRKSNMVTLIINNVFHFPSCIITCFLVAFANSCSGYSVAAGPAQRLLCPVAMLRRSECERERCGADAPAAAPGLCLCDFYITGPPGGRRQNLAEQRPPGGGAGAAVGRRGRGVGGHTHCGPVSVEPPHPPLVGGLLGAPRSSAGSLGPAPGPGPTWRGRRDPDATQVQRCGGHLGTEAQTPPAEGDP